MFKKYNKDKIFPRSDVDRRKEDDRRKVYSLNYQENNGTERRSELERRRSGETRNNWIRYSKWRSVYIGKYDD